jgi:hypothetical protein
VASAKLKAIIKGLIKKPDGHFALGPLTVLDARCLMLATNLVYADTAFTGEQLADDLIATLVHCGLLEHSEIRQFMTLSPLIMMFAISEMHNSTLIMKDGSRAELSFGVYEGNMNVVVTCPPMRLENKHVRLTTPLYMTPLKAVEHCEPELLPGRELGEHWGRDLEITQNRRLGFLA